MALECLEPRTVLSATQIVVVAMDPDALTFGPPPAPRYEPMFHDSAPMDRGAPPSGTAHVSPQPFHLTYLLFVKEVGSDASDLPPPAPQDKAPAMSPPPSDLPAYSPEFGIPPEGEFGAPDRFAQEPPGPYSDLLPPTGGTDHVPLVNQTRSVRIADTLSQVNSQSALSGLFATAMATTDWVYDAGSLDTMSGLDSLSRLRDQATARDTHVTDLQVDDVAQAAFQAAPADMPWPDSSEWFDSVLRDILLPMDEDDSTAILWAEEEGGLIDIGISAESLVPSDVQHAEKAAAKPEPSSDERERVAHDQSRQDPALHQQEQAYMVDSDQPVVDLARGNDQRAVVQRESASAGVDEEGGLIESLVGGESLRPIGDEPSAAHLIRSFGTIEVRMDAEVGVHQAFELSTKPQVANAQAETTCRIDTVVP